MKFLTLILFILGGLIAKGAYADHVLFRCYNPPTTKGTDCFTDGIAFLKSYCTLTGNVSADNCNLQRTDGKKTDGKKYAWVCTFSSSDCSQKPLVRTGYSSAERSYEELICGKLGSDGYPTELKDPAYDVVNLPASRKMKFDGLRLCVLKSNPQTNSVRPNNNVDRAK